jgi:hypothetical protein
MHLVCEGESNKKVGRKLNLSESTVKVHLHHIYQKLAIRNRTALAAGGAAVQGRRAMTHRLVKAARGKHMGKRVDKPDEAEHALPELRRADRYARSRPGAGARHPAAHRAARFTIECP